MRKWWVQEAQEGRKDEKKAFKGCKWVEVKRERWGSGRVGVQMLDAQSSRVRTV